MPRCCLNHSNQNLSLDEAARDFLAGLPAEEREASQQEIGRFVRWFGRECPIAGLTAPEIASYAEHLSLSDTDYARKLELIRGFLAHAKKAGWTLSNLVIHLKVKKVKAKVAGGSGRAAAEDIMLTREGYAELEAELATLKGKRLQTIDEVRRAAADKDFRENAPLEAAREQRGHIEGRIRELEEALKSARVIGDKQRISLKASLGNTVVLSDLASGEELRYIMVSPTEVDPGRCKISSVSPLGKAVIGRSQGDIVEVSVPAGKLRYQIKDIIR